MANFNVSKMSFHPTSEKIAKHLSNKTQNTNMTLFYVMLTYYYGMMASHMRVGIHGFGDQVLPINIYAVCISESGTGKGVTMNMLNKELTHKFKDLFLEETFPASAETEIISLSNSRATRRGTDPSKEEEKIIKEYLSAGEMLFQFSEGTPAAAKQLRHKLCLAKAGAINFIVDEIGVNLLGQKDMINLFLELYDTGRVEDKLVKNTADNQRVERVEGSTPSNMLLTGAGSALFDGGEIENKFNAMLETGYARRCIFSYSRDDTKVVELTAAEVLKQMFNKQSNQYVSLLADQFEGLADIANLNKVIKLKEPEAIYLIEYRQYCTTRGAKFREHQKALKSEMDNRYFKVMKLSGAYAFVDGLDVIPKDYIDYAIKVVELAGEEFHKMMTPEKDYMKLAKFLLSFPDGVTLSDLDQNLSYFRGSKQAKDEVVNNAIAWGYKNNILITKTYVDQILFIKASSLEETDLDNLIISVSSHAAEGYGPQEVALEDLEDLGSTATMNWCNHHFNNDYRHQENLIKGFNMVVFDIDDGTPIHVAKQLFQDYYHVIYETKRSTPDFNRYRIILPISHVLELERTDYKQFMRNLIDSIPFKLEVDDGSLQPDKKWLTCDKGVYINDVRYIRGVEHDPLLFNALPYIPKTAENEKLMQKRIDIADLDKVQRWVYENTGEGNRSDNLYKYAMILVDMGCDAFTLETKVLELNSNLLEPLTEKEVKNTILLSATKKLK